MVENGPCLSQVLRLHIDRRMDPNTKTLVGPLMEMLEVVIAEQTISPSSRLTCIWRLSS